MAFPGGTSDKKPTCQCRRDVGSIPGSGRSLEGGHGNPLQYSYLENPKEKGAWWATVHKVTKSWTQLKRLSTQATTSASQWLSGKESICNAGDTGSIPGWGRSLGEGNGNPLLDSCLGNAMDRGALWAMSKVWQKSRTGLSN